MSSAERIHWLRVYKRYQNIIGATEELLMTCELSDSELERLTSTLEYYTSAKLDIVIKLMEDRQGE